jgi:hypothetical protein
MLVRIIATRAQKSNLSSRFLGKRQSEQITTTFGATHIILLDFKIENRIG